MKINEDFITRSKLDDIGRFYVTDFVKRIAQSLPPGTLLLDAGAGECVYRKFFTHCSYKSVDMGIGETNWNYSNLDVIASLNRLPFKDKIFDAVLCTQVLEHLSHPAECLKEMYRVLKPHGRLFLTVPMSQNEHQIPHDFFRYTSYGLRYLCSEAGFRYIEVTPFGGMFVRWAYEFPRAISVFPEVCLRKGAITLKMLPFAIAKLICLFVIRFLQIILLNLDRFDRKKNDPWGWKLIAEK